jgi:hypothetical protein
MKSRLRRREERPLDCSGLSAGAPYWHLCSAPGVASLFCPGGHFPAGFVLGCPLLLGCVIPALATPVDAKTMADVNSAMRFFMEDPPSL